MSHVFSKPDREEVTRDIGMACAKRGQLPAHRELLRRRGGDPEVAAVEVRRAACCGEPAYEVIPGRLS